MWLELENTHNNQGVVQIENNLREEKLKLMDLFSETTG